MGSTRGTASGVRSRPEGSEAGRPSVAGRRLAQPAASAAATSAAASSARLPARSGAGAAIGQGGLRMIEAGGLAGGVAWREVRWGGVASRRAQDSAAPRLRESAPTPATLPRRTAPHRP
jgi:hypothetical protein